MRWFPSVRCVRLCAYCVRVCECLLAITEKYALWWQQTMKLHFLSLACCGLNHNGMLYWLARSLRINHYLRHVMLWWAVNEFCPHLLFSHFSVAIGAIKLLNITTTHMTGTVTALPISKMHTTNNKSNALSNNKSGLYFGVITMLFDRNVIFIRGVCWNWVSLLLLPVEFNEINANSIEWYCQCNKFQV